MRRRWSLAPTQPVLGEHLARANGISPLLAQCLLNRGLSEQASVARFLEPRLRHLADPFLLPDMSAAVARLHHARESRETVVLFGDYDVDGVTATALLSEVLEDLGWEVRTYLPHRMEEGYGLTREGVENCLRQHPGSLLLAVDCGSSSADTVDWLREKGVETIIVDHHQIGATAPSAVALVNPQSAGVDGPSFRELCSAGLAFKLAHALVKRGREEGWERESGYDLRPLLDLVALGTVADVVPLVGENRILTAAGIGYLNRTRRPGLVALREVSGIERPIGSYEIGYQLGPRLNAAGRLEDAQEALRLVMAQDMAEARTLARGLDGRNRERQAIQRAMAREVMANVQTRFDPERDFVVVEGDESWHLGVVGIVASRVLRRFHRPTILLGGDGAHWRGSGRSIEGVDLARALEACGDLLLRYGGHAMAAGVSMDPRNLGAFRQRLNEQIGRMATPDLLRPVVRLDAEVRLADLDMECMHELQRLQHTGAGNPPVQLMVRGLWHQRPLRRMGADKQHVKCWVTDGQAVLEAVWWGGGEEPLPVGEFDLAFEPQMNRYRGRDSVQMKILDWRPAT